MQTIPNSGSAWTWIQYRCCSLTTITIFIRHCVSCYFKDILLIIEGLLKSLDEPDLKIDEIWAEEAEKRLEAYRNGNLN